MSVEAKGGWFQGDATNRNCGRSAVILAGYIATIAAPLALLAIVMGQSGFGGPLGVVAAAAICLVAGWTAEAVASVVNRAGSPLAALLVGMALRLFLPLAVCLVLAVRGGGRQHLAFVIYLLTFYVVILTLDTWWAVRRAAGATSKSTNR